MPRKNPSHTAVAGHRYVTTTRWKITRRPGQILRRLNVNGEAAIQWLKQKGHIEDAANLYRRAVTLREKGRAERSQRLPEMPSVTLREA